MSNPSAGPSSAPLGGRSASTGAVRMSASTLGAFGEHVAQNLLNGTVAATRTVLVHPSVPTAYKNVSVKNASGTCGTSLAMPMIRSAFAQLMSNVPKDMTEPTMRKLAIVLGAARAVIFQTWNADGKYNPTEVAQPLYEWTEPQGSTKGFYSVVDGSDDVLVAIAQRMVDLSEEEQIVLAEMLPCFVATLVLAGLSLLSTGHHYLSGGGSRNQSRKAAEAVEKQFMMSETMKTWIGTDKEMIQDVLWHKAPHPVQTDLKESLCQLLAVKEKLIKAGVGSAAVRLPYVPSARKVANSYSTILLLAQSTVIGSGGTIDRFNLDHAIVFYDDMQALRPRTAKLTYVPAEYKTLEQSVLFLENAVKAAESAASYCYGIVAYMKENADTGKGTMTTIMDSYSLGKLVDTPGYMMGYELARLYRIKTKADAADGKFIALDLSTGGESTEAPAIPAN